MKTRTAPEHIEVISEGRYAVHISLQPPGATARGENRYGWIMDWYNIEDDPMKLINLGPYSGFPLIKPHHLNREEKLDGEWKHLTRDRWKELRTQVELGPGMQQGPMRYQHGSVEFEVFEDTPARVRTRTSHDQWPSEVFEYTFYPAGQIFVGASFVTERSDPDVRLASFGLYNGKSGRINWRAIIGGGKGHMHGEGAYETQTPFILEHSNEGWPSYRDTVADDLLYCPAAPGDYRSYANNEIPLSWRRSPLRVGVDSSADKQHYALQIRIYPRNINSWEAGVPYLEDYQNPGRLGVTIGELVTDDAGDLNTDGYNESEGCYVLKADGGKVKFTLDATERPRYQPAFKVTGWAGGKPKSVTVNGEAAKEGKTYNAASLERKGALVLQLLEAYDGKEFEVEVR
jgi:hypothetical protein